MKVGHIIQGGKFPVVTPIDGPQRHDWLRTGLGVEVLGRLADNDGWNGEIIGPEASADVMYEHLYRRAATIYGGSNEIQRNIIAQMVLGL